MRSGWTPNSNQATPHFRAAENTMLSDVLQKGSPRHHFRMPATPEGSRTDSKKPEKDSPVEVQVWLPTRVASSSLHKNSSLEHLQDKCESEARCLHMRASPADLLEGMTRTQARAEKTHQQGHSRQYRSNSLYPEVHP